MFQYTHNKSAPVDLLTLEAEIKGTVGLESLEGVAFFEDPQDVVATFTDELDAGQITSFTNVCNAHDENNLERQKRDKLFAIDQKTIYLISQGYTHNSKQFSLSILAQTSLNGLYSRAKNDLLLSYPVEISTATDEQVDLADAAAVEAQYNAAFDRVRDLKEGGTNLKQAVKDAADQAALDAVVDDRT